MAKSQHGPENYWKQHLWMGLDNLIDPGRMKLGKVHHKYEDTYQR